MNMCNKPKMLENEFRVEHISFRMVLGNYFICGYVEVKISMGYKIDKSATPKIHLMFISKLCMLNYIIDMRHFSPG